MPRGSAASALLVFGLLQMVCIVVGIMRPDYFRYLSASNIEILLRAVPPLAIVSIGVGILMIAGEFDLSVGATFTLTSLVMAESHLQGWPLPLCMALALVVGIAIGATNGLIVLRLKITSFIATLGTMMMLRGIILLFSGAQSKAFRPNEFFQSLMAGHVGFMQAQFIWLLIAAFCCYALLERHCIGNHIFAVGGSRESANAVGVAVSKIKLLSFCIASSAATFAGILSTTRVNSVSPTQGQGLELQAIAACVIGGVALTGGRGSVLGIFVGAALIYTVQDILLLTSAPGYYLDAFVGFFIVCAAVFNRLLNRED